MRESDQTSLREQVAAALAQLRGIKIDEQAVFSHVIRPEHTMTASSDQGAVEPLAPHPPVGPPDMYVLDTDGFIADIQQDLANVEGYVIGLNQNGSPFNTVVSGYAHQPKDTTEDWTPLVRQHIASLSKNITAMAMIKALIAAGLSPDATTPIIDYLPTYWVKGQNIDQITIAELLTHTSGITLDDNTTPADFQTMMAAIAAGVSANDIGTYAYRNVNFALCRVLLAAITGTVPVDWVLDWPWPFGPWPFLTDVLWDCASIRCYEDYVATNVFAPAWVDRPSLQHSPDDALAYPFSPGAKGWNSGDLSTLAGADGWHMSVVELLAVMLTFRRSNAILTPVQAQNMLDARFGIDILQNTQLGVVYAKSGFWNNPAGETEQGVLFYLPQDMELVVLVNSPIGPKDSGYLAQLVYNAYQNNIEAVEILAPPL
jgi:Beta-lactamase